MSLKRRDSHLGSVRQGPAGEEHRLRPTGLRLAEEKGYDSNHLMKGL